MAKKSQGWNNEMMQGTLIADMQKAVTSGYQEMAQPQQPVAPVQAQPTVPTTPTASTLNAPKQDAPAKADEPTKGVQTYIPMSMYRRLNDLKLQRGETIGSLVVQAIATWLDIQEGKGA